MPSSTRTRRAQAVALTLAAMVGGVAGSGAYALSGADQKTTTIVQSAASTTPVADRSGARALYATASAGVVDVSARTTSSEGFGPPQEATATGAGFLADSEGRIVTAAHVVEGATSITVTFQDGAKRTATVLGRDEATDVAVLKVDPSGLTLHPLALAKSSALAVGDGVYAIGDPFGYQRSFSTGVVSGVDRTIDAPNGFTVAHAIQTDAALNPGNSGGPLLDSSGRVIGVVDQIATGDSGAEQSSGVGFAVPSDLVASELSALEDGKTVRHAYLGVSTSETTGGALVAGVAAGGPAASAGVRAGDVVTRIGGASVAGGGELVSAIAAHQPGDRLELTLRRSGKTVTVTVTLGSQPSPRAG